MKVLDKGTIKLDNAEILKWIGEKRHQHSKIQALEKKHGSKGLSSMPTNFSRSLEKHEHYLTRQSKPYKNNAAYGKANKESIGKFADLLEQRILSPIEAEFKAPGISVEVMERQHKEYEKKELTESELLIIANLRPSNVAMLQPMIEMVTERFSEDEQQIIVDSVKEVYG